MAPTTKIIVGAVATAALASLFHGPLGGGDAFIGSLGAQASAKAATLPGVSAAMDTQDWLSRGVILSGPASADERAAKLAEMKAIPGMAWAQWAAESPVVPRAANTDQTPATPQAVATCQADVDNAIKGKTVKFESGTATLSASSLSLIETLSASIAACAGTRVEVAGHTDTTGGDAANQRLSEARANAVVEALVAKGVPVARLLPKGYGEARPVDPAATETANTANRRIEFAVATAS